MTTPAPTNLTLEIVRPRLRRLGFYGLLAHAETLLNEPWLARVIDLEERERSHRSLKRRLDQARLGRFKPIADFDWTWPTKCDRGLIEELFSLAFIEEAANVVFFGSNGLGKTMLFKNLAHQALLHGHSARYILASDMLHDLAAQDSSTALARRIRRYTRPTLLAVDSCCHFINVDLTSQDLVSLVTRRFLDHINFTACAANWSTRYHRSEGVLPWAEQLHWETPAIGLRV